MLPSKNSLIARSGFSAERILCHSPHVLECIGVYYFQKPIKRCDLVPKNKKSDVVFTFEDETQARVQVKNGTGGGRGWSFDRRSIECMPTNEPAKELIRIVCLKATGERKCIPMDINLIKDLIFGTEEDSMPEHFIHTEVKDDHIVRLSGCSASEFLDAITKDAYETFNAKKTCVHLTPLIYLQRKGGGKTDHSPDDIQAKLRCMPNCMKPIPLETTQTQPEQMPQEP